jgi:hypothetical protein
VTDRDQADRRSGSADPERELLVTTAETLAAILDSAVRIPGTRITVGLDPLLGLIPGVGDLLASLIGAAILGIAVRLRVPKIVLARMCLNLLLNGALGAVPGAGDAFSVWFRSNVRNAALLRRVVQVPHPTTAPDWAFVIGILGTTLALLIGAILAILWLLARLWELLR